MIMTATVLICGCPLSLLKRLGHRRGPGLLQTRLLIISRRLTYNATRVWIHHYHRKARQVLVNQPQALERNPLGGNPLCLRGPEQASLEMVNRPQSQKSCPVLLLRADLKL